MVHYCLVILACGLCIACAGCATISDTVGGSLSDGDGAPDALSGSPSAGIAYDKEMFRNSLNLGERFKYDDATGISYDDTSGKNTVSLFVEEATERSVYRIRDMKTGSLNPVDAASGMKFFFVTVTAVHLGGYHTDIITPHPYAFSLIAEGIAYAPLRTFDSSLGAQIRNYRQGEENYRTQDLQMAERFVLDEFGEIYIQKSLDKPGKEMVSQNGWLVFEVPETLDDTNAFLQLNLAGSRPWWKLFDAQVDVTVRKDPIYSTIIAEFRGGPGTRTVRDIDIDATLSDKTTAHAVLMPVIGEETELQGTSGDDYVKVVVNLYSGKRFVLYDDVVRKTRG